MSFPFVALRLLYGGGLVVVALHVARLSDCDGHADAPA